MLAKNRIVGQQLNTKSGPALELHAVALGVQTVHDVYNELSGRSSVVPINVLELELYSDSLVSLSWINKCVNKLDKMQKCSVFVMNRLNSIIKLCNVYPVKFHFIAGKDNPADFITRTVSYKMLLKSNYLTGPEFLTGPPPAQSDITFVVPNTHAKTECTIGCEGESVCANLAVIPADRYSSFHKLVTVYRLLLKYIKKLKMKVALKKNEK